MKPTGKAGRPRNKSPHLKGATQFERFVETAKSLEVDESGEAFEQALNKVIPKPTASRSRPRVKRSSSSIP